MKGHDWDDAAAQRALDREDMAQAIAGMAEVVAKAFFAGQQLKRPSHQVRCVVVVAMGGSAIGADLLRGLAGSMAPWPLVVHRGPGLPAWAGPQDLLLFSSHSGNTAETLDAFEHALARQIPAMVITSGGQLGAKAQSIGLPILRLPPGGAPRAALGWGLFGLAGLLMGDADGWPERLVQVRAALLRRAQSCGLDSPLAHNPAKQLAQRVVGHTLGVVAGSPNTEAVARRWACQFHENSKVLAWCNALPEWSHNEVVPWGSRAQNQAKLIWLDGPEDSPLARAQRNAAFELLGDAHGVLVLPHGESLHDPWAAVMDLVGLGDWTSLHLAFANRVDPTPIEPILALKAKLAASL